jgi:hypothetical protein
MACTQEAHACFLLGRGKGFLKIIWILMLDPHVSMMFVEHDKKIKSYQDLKIQIFLLKKFDV